MKAINPYASRRLPHIIGTKEFEEDDTLGLMLTPSDDEQSDGEQSPLEELPRSRNQVRLPGIDNLKYGHEVFWEDIIIIDNLHDVFLMQK